MTPEEKRKYAKAQREAAAEREKLMKRTRAELIALLDEARDRTVVLLAKESVGFQQWRAAALQAEIDRVLDELKGEAGKVASAASQNAWVGGSAMVSAPLNAIGLQVPAVVLNTTQLMAMQTFMVDRITDISTVAATTIKRELGLMMIGSNSLQEAVTAVSVALGEVSSQRATTIVRTELGRAWSVGADESAKQAEQAGVKIEKIWNRSGKTFPRPSHAPAHGLSVPMGESFTINGHKMRFPHDPKAPASETINCGCICLYRPLD